MPLIQTPGGFVLGYGTLGDEVVACDAVNPLPVAAIRAEATGTTAVATLTVLR